MSAADEAERFVRSRLPVGPAPCVPEVRLHLAGPSSGVGRLAGGSGPPPYWAYVWGGGAALARRLLDHPEAVRGRRVLDLGCGGGVVAIAAALAGARHVLAADIDPLALTALKLNAALNGVAVEAVCADLLDGAPPDAQLIAVGDLFYHAALAARVAAFLGRCLEAGIEVLVGDPYRRPLPLDRLRLIADYRVRDFGEGETTAGVFALTP